MSLPINPVYTAHMLELFPPSIKDSLLSSDRFVKTLGVGTDAVIALSSGEVSFERSRFFGALRELHEGASSVDLEATSGEVFRLAFETSHLGVKVIAIEGAKKYVLPTFWFLSPNAEYRLSEFDKEAQRRNLRDQAILAWRERLAKGALPDDEVEALQLELHSNPDEIAETIRSQVRTGTSDVDVLVPRSPNYYSRLVGPPPLEGMELHAFASEVISHHFKQLIDWDFVKGLKQCLLSAPQGTLSGAIDATLLDERVVEVLQWLSQHGDRPSQVVGIEVGLRVVEQFREIEPLLLQMIKSIIADEPGNADGRLRLTSSLIAFVDGELARTSTLRDRAPFARRLAAIAQASLIERELLAVGVHTSRFADWANEGRGQFFFLQTLVDLRTEPRWLPDFISPEQLKYEFLGRLSAIGAERGHLVQNSELKRLLTDESGIRSMLDPPYAFLPGPLEGGTTSPLNFPSDLAAELDKPIGSDGIPENAFALIVNMALVFKMDGKHASAVAGLLRQAKHQVAVAADSGKIFALLIGLATVAAVTRSSELAKEVRILARVMRRRPGVKLTTDNLMRIGMVASASESEIEPWSIAVGDWLTEVSFEDLDKVTAQMMRWHVRTLCHLAPSLWKTCSRAEAGFAVVGGMAA